MTLSICFTYTDNGRRNYLTRTVHAFTDEINAIYHWLRWCGYKDVEFKEVV